MLENRMIDCACAGASSRGIGGFAQPLAAVLVVACSLLSVACGDKDEKRSLEPIQLGMTNDIAPAYEIEDLELYEVKLAVPFPIAAPTEQDLAALGGRAVPPFSHYPFVTNKDVQVQVSWTLTNLDEDSHNVYLLVDPWNEFGRYVPGLALVDAEDGEFEPNNSGIQVFRPLPGTKDKGDSRLNGLFTIEDMNEMAIDFSTAMNIIANPPPVEDGEEDPTVSLVNHAFAREQRSNRDALSKPYIPGVIAGLTGFDLGLRTTEPANIAVEVVVEVIDKGSGKVLERGSKTAPMPEPTEVVTVAYQGM